MDRTHCSSINRIVGTTSRGLSEGPGSSTSSPSSFQIQQVSSPTRASLWPVRASRHRKVPASNALSECLAESQLLGLIGGISSYQRPFAAMEAFQMQPHLSIDDHKIRHQLDQILCGLHPSLSSQILLAIARSIAVKKCGRLGPYKSSTEGDPPHCHMGETRLRLTTTKDDVLPFLQTSTTSNPLRDQTG